MTYTRRRTIKPHVRQLVLLEAGYKCGNPTCRNILTLQLHHITWVRDGGGDDETNLLPLCGHCHDLHTQGHIPGEAIRVWKSALASLNSVNRDAADLLIHLQRTHQDERVARYAVYSSGDLLQVAGLINAGLVDARMTQAGSGSMMSPPFLCFRLILTSRGEDFVSAWKDGRENALSAAIQRRVDDAP